MAGTRRTPKTRAWQEGFLEAFRQAGTVKGACEAAGVARSTVYRERQANEDFALAWAEVEEDTTDELEVEAVRRAKDGSDTLLIFLLKCRRPTKYQDRARVEHTGAEGSAIKVQSQDFADPETRRLAHELLARMASERADDQR